MNTCRATESDLVKVSSTIQAPSNCPMCGGQVFRRVNVGNKIGAVLECRDRKCSGRTIALLGNWIGKLDIQGIGDGILDALIAKYEMSTPADLYKLATDPVKMAFLPGITIGKSKVAGRAGPKLGLNRAKAIIDNIKSKQKLTLNIFLGSLGVPYLGRRRVQLIREAVPGEFDALADWRGDKLLRFAAQANIPNIAVDIKQGIDAAAPVIDELVSCITIVTDTPAAPAADQLSFVLTGAMSKPRKEIIALIEAKGYIVKDSISAGVTYLVQASADSVSSKSKKAQRLGTKVISEEDLYNLLK